MIFFMTSYGSRKGQTKKPWCKPAVLVLLSLPAVLAACSLFRTVPAFVTQPGGGNNQCGAFSTAYYQWLRAGKTYSGDIQADNAEVDAIYSGIQFGSAFADALKPYGIPVTYSDPLKIMKFLGSGNTGAAGIMHRKPGDALIDSLYALLSRLETEDFNAACKEDRLIPELDAAHPYAIVLCKSKKGSSLHYMLFQRLESGGLVYYDPYTGAPAPANYAMMNGSAGLDSAWVSSGCGILLP
jgi:hypothetical protein